LYAGLDKDTAKICIERIIKQMSEDSKSVTIFLFPNLFLRGN
jgi:hypothetical protein